MGIINELFDVEERAATIHDVDNFLDWLISSGGSSTGVTVTETEAMKHAAVFSCVKVISEDVASLPWLVYRRIDEKARERAQKHWLFLLLHRQPNPEMTAFEYKEFMMANLLLWGNHYTFVDRDQKDRIKGLWPMLPNKMAILRERGELIYRYHLSDNTAVDYLSRDIWHLKGLGSNGITGYSPIRQMAESIGFGIAVQKFGSQFFKNGTRLSGLLKHPGRLTKDVAKRIVTSWQASYSGLENVAKVALLEEGMDWVQLGIPPEDAQFLGSRDFSRSEIAGLYRLAPHKIGDLTHATFSNIEEQNVDHWGGCIHPWVTRLEISADVKLLGPREGYNHFTEFLMDAKLRGKIEDRYRAYATARQWGWMSANDVRALENQNPIKGGNVYYMPMNMLPANFVKEEKPIPLKPEGEGEEEEETNEEVKGYRDQWLILIQKRSIENREKLRKTYRRLFKDVGKRLVRKEIKIIKNLIKKTLDKGKVNEFSEEIKKFYGKFGSDIKEFLDPITRSYAEQIQETCVKEFDQEEKSDIRIQVYCTCEGKQVDLNMLIDHYEEAATQNYIGKSQNTIEGLIKETPIDDLMEIIIKTLDDWDLNRPEQIAVREVVKIDGFVSRATFFGLGAKKVKWVCTDTDTSLFSLALNNRGATIDEAFLRKGDVLLPEGVKKGMEIKFNIYHPPLYRGDSSSIVKE